LVERHPEFRIARVSVPSSHIFDAGRPDNEAFAIVNGGGGVAGFDRIPAWAYHPLSQVKRNVVEFCRSQPGYFFNALADAKSMFVAGFWRP